mgnify:CR=1 FL=1
MEPNKAGIPGVSVIAAEAGLAALPLLEGLPLQAVLTLEQACRWLRVAAGVVVVRHDDPDDDAVYFLISGGARIFFRMPHQEREVNFAVVGAGDMFGELAAIDGLGRSASVMTTEETVLAACPRPVFLEALQRWPQLTFRVLLKFARMIRHSDQQIMRLAALPAIQRVYLELLRLAVPDVSGDGTWVITPAPLHKDIANWAGTTTDVVGRAVGQLMRADLLRRHGPGLQIIDRLRVEMLAHVPGGDVMETAGFHV